MQIQLVGSTNNITTKEEALLFGRSAARVCYTSKDFSELADEENPAKLINQTLDSGHHSVYDHIHLNFYLTGIPKFLAMILNNEQYYSTSEKSARYTKMEVSGEQKTLYDKWLTIFGKETANQYPAFDLMKVTKLAQENARYLTSVFTPTKMLYTVSFRQLNRIMHGTDYELASLPDTTFYSRIKELLNEFRKIETIDKFFEERLDYRNKKMGLSIFGKENSPCEEYGENYSITYKGSFAQLAQAHRHRTIKYEMLSIDEKIKDFFVPRIIESNKVLTEEWLGDINKIAENEYPQGMLIKIHESGSHDNFMAKCYERLCGLAQIEIMLQTKKTLEIYIQNTQNQEVRTALLRLNKGPKCTFPDTKCATKCPFGPAEALKRKV